MLTAKMRINSLLARSRISNPSIRDLNRPTRRLQSTHNNIVLYIAGGKKKLYLTGAPTISATSSLMDRWQLVTANELVITVASLKSSHDHELRHPRDRRTVLRPRHRQLVCPLRPHFWTRC